ncbi:MAG: hypothetical protein Kow00109_01280 [Acidobacteriota bacterium]
MIRDFLRDKVILITGATGFLGQPLVEKILWVAPDVRRIYVLIRPKFLFGGRQISPEQRLEKELFNSTAFERLRYRLGSEFDQFVRDKVRAIAGDLAQEQLGLSGEAAQRLRSEIDIVINSAAVVSFDAPLDEALEMNVRGAERVASFAASCAHARLLHISTAYVCGAAQGDVPEDLHQDAQESGAAKDEFPTRKIHDIDREIAAIESIIESVEVEARSRDVRRELIRAYLEARARRKRKLQRRAEIAKLQQRWLAERLAEEGMAWARKRGWNDTYTYTKALGELVVLRAAQNIPVGIVRPAVIESSLNEPSPGWLDGLRMADPLIVAIGKGRLKSLPLNPDVPLDLVPADMVVNASLALLPRLQKAGIPEIIQVATSSRNPITLGELYELIYQYFLANPLLDRDGNPIILKRLKFPRPSAFRLQYRLRALPLDTAEKTLERLGSFEPAQRVRKKISSRRAASEKLYYYGELYEPYLNLDCRFKVDRLYSLYEELEEEERAEFDFDVSRLNWRHYIQNVHIPGVKKYILKLEGAGSFELPEPTEKDFPATIIDLLERSAAKFAERVALQWKAGSDWERFTYQEVLEGARLVGRRLMDLGLQKGDRVVLFAENRPEWGICHLGALWAGLVVVPLDWQTWHREVWSVARFTEARAILASEKALSRLTGEELQENENAAEPCFLLSVNRLAEPFKLPDLPRSTDPPARAAQAREFPCLSADDPAAIVFTTGTMAEPRGAVHTHRTFLNNLRGVDHYLSVSESDRLVSVLPLYHCLEFTCGFLMPLHRGAMITYSHSLKPRVILELMRETKATCLLGVPTLFALIREDLERRVLKIKDSALLSNVVDTSQRLNASLEEKLGKNLGRRLFTKIHREFGGNVRVLVSGGSALGTELYRYFKSLGLTIYEGYGLTETAPVLTVNPLHQSREGSAGKPLPGVELRIYRPDQDGIGEIIVRTPSLMVGYYKNEEATKAVIRDGWFHTGDLGWVDTDGYVYITGRCKDVIVTGAGKNVYPSDLEAIYSTLPSVREICVFGVKSGLTEDVHAVVVPAPSEEAFAERSKQAQRAIQALARELPSYQRLQQIHFRDEPLPRKPDGSLDRKVIREEALARLAGRGVESSGKPIQGGIREQLLSELVRLSGLPREEISEESNLYSDLGLDSLAAMELLLFVERELGLAVPDERIPEFQTVGDLLDELRRAEAAGTPRGKGAPSIHSALPYGDRPQFERTVLELSFRSLARFYRRYLGLEVRNARNLPARGPFILAANHASHLDSGAVIAAVIEARGLELAKTLHVIGARDYFFDSRLKGWLFATCLNVVPIERDEVGLQGVRLVGGILQRGESVLIFPEGTRSRTGRIQKFRPGVGLLAWEYKVPVIPVFLEGTFDALPPGTTRLRRNRVRVWFGEAVDPEDFQRAAPGTSADEAYRSLTTVIEDRVLRLAREAGAAVTPGIVSAGQP